MLFINKQLSTTQCPHTNEFMLFYLVCYAYELTVKMPTVMASIGF